MPTIKRKVEMNLPQLIEWGWNNKELSKNKRFISKNKGNLAIKQSVIFNHFSYAEIENNYCYGPEDTFTVEVEEEITEDTVLPESLVVFEHNGNLYTERNNSKCISKLLCLDKKVKGSDTKTIYILNEGGTLTLIWTKEEGLVE